MAVVSGIRRLQPNERDGHRIPTQCPGGKTGFHKGGAADVEVHLLDERSLRILPMPHSSRGIAHRVRGTQMASLRRFSMGIGEWRLEVGQPRTEFRL